MNKDPFRQGAAPRDSSPPPSPSPTAPSPPASELRSTIFLPNGC